MSEPFRSRLEQFRKDVRIFAWEQERQAKRSSGTKFGETLGPKKAFCRKAKTEFDSYNRLSPIPEVVLEGERSVVAAISEFS
jgi:hypothetical protein